MHVLLLYVSDVTLHWMQFEMVESVPVPDQGKGEAYWEKQLHDANDMVKAGFAQKGIAEYHLYQLQHKATAEAAAKAPTNTDLCVAGSLNPIY